MSYGLRKVCCGCGLFPQVKLGFRLVNADAAGFDHPEAPGERPNGILDLRLEIVDWRNAVRREQLSD